MKVSKNTAPKFVSETSLDPLAKQGVELTLDQASSQLRFERHLQMTRQLVGKALAELNNWRSRLSPWPSHYYDPVGSTFNPTGVPLDLHEDP